MKHYMRQPYVLVRTNCIVTNSIGSLVGFDHYEGCHLSIMLLEQRGPMHTFAHALEYTRETITYIGCKLEIYILQVHKMQNLILFFTEQHEHSKYIKQTDRS